MKLIRVIPLPLLLGGCGTPATTVGEGADRWKTPPLATIEAIDPPPEADQRGEPGGDSNAFDRLTALVLRPPPPACQPLDLPVARLVAGAYAEIVSPEALVPLLQAWSRLSEAKCHLTGRVQRLERQHLAEVAAAQRALDEAMKVIRRGGRPLPRNTAELYEAFYEVPERADLVPAGFDDISGDLDDAYNEIVLALTHENAEVNAALEKGAIETFAACPCGEKTGPLRLISDRSGSCSRPGVVTVREVASWGTLHAEVEALARGCTDELIPILQRSSILRAPPSQELAEFTGRVLTRSVQKKCLALLGNEGAVVALISAAVVDPSPVWRRAAQALVLVMRSKPQETCRAPDSQVAEFVAQTIAAATETSSFMAEKEAMVASISRWESQVDMLAQPVLDALERGGR